MSLIRISSLAIVIALFPFLSLAQTGNAPTINAVMNVASYSDQAVSPGEMVVIFGTSLGPTTLTHLRVGADGKLVNELEGVKIFASGLPCPLIYVSQYQLSAMIPYGIAALPTTKIEVFVNGVKSNAFEMAVAQSAPGIFTTDASGHGPAAMNNSDGTMNGPTSPAMRGNWITFYLTGEGQITPAGKDGQIVWSTTSVNLPVKVRIAGYEAPLLYAGSAPGNVNGFAQINAIVPPELPYGGDLPLTVEIGGVVSRPDVTVSVSGPAAPKPAVPTNLSITEISTGAIQTTWKGNGPAAGMYLVERAVNGGGFKQVARVAGNLAVYNDMDVAEDSEFSYRVQAYNDWGMSSYSDVVRLKKSKSGIQSPTQLQSTSISPTEVMLTWQNNDPAASQIGVERRASSDSSFAEIARIDATNSFRVTGLLPATLYKFRVRALKNTASSSYSNESTTTTPGVTPPPPAPVVEISLTPTLRTLNPGESQQFIATVTGSANTGVSWSASPQVGTLSASGLYTAPGSVSTATIVTITALSLADTSKSASAIVTLAPNPPPPDPTPTVQISVTPTSKTLSAGQSQQFTATVTGSANTGVTWTASPQVGTISASGLYTAPATISAATVVTITGRSVADTTITATATVTLAPTVQISVSPTSTTLSNGQTQQFSATVTGSGNTGVTWTMSPQVGTLSANGFYTAPASFSSPQTVTITAQSVADTTKTAAATIALVPSVQISVTPPSTTLTDGQSQQFSATVTGSGNTGVNWTMSPQVGTLSANGLYMAPASISSAVGITITARSVADTTKTATATVTLAPTVQISVSPTSTTLSNGQTQQFSATVTGSGNTSVTWTASPQVGNVSANGLYTAPASVTSTQSVTITARSVADTSKTATATVTLTPTVQISVTPASKTLYAGQSQQFSATVTGSGNTSVTWTSSPQVGTLSSSGLFTAPGTITSTQSVTITARSVADTTKTAAATVTLAPTSTTPPPTNPDIRSFWTTSQSPSAVTDDTAGVVVGLRFQSSVPGDVVGIRFYKWPNNTGSHIGTIWSAAGANLGQVTFSGESSSGWQQANFASPVRIAANTEYVASYLAPSGYYAEDQYYNWSSLSASPLQVVGTSPSVYTYSSTNQFPTSTWRSANYWVDVAFVPDSGAPIPPPVSTYTISGTVSGAGATLSLSGTTTATTSIASAGSYSFTNLPNGAYVVVPSKSGYTFSPSSAAVSIAGSSVGGVNFTAVAVPPTARTVTLNWSPSSSPNVSGYNIYRSGTGGGPYSKLNTSLIGGTSYVDVNVVSGQTYYYVATAVDSGGAESTYSNQASAPLN